MLYSAEYVMIAHRAFLNVSVTLSRSVPAPSRRLFPAETVALPTELYPYGRGIS